MTEVSVVINMYNSEKYLRKCIDSVLAQTFTDFELILVNDGSKDHSLDICKEYAEKDKRIRIVDKENGGLADARNAGLDAAKGKYLEFIDADDWIEPDLLEKCVTKLHETDADIVIFDIYQYFVATGKKEVVSHPYNQNQVYFLNDHPEMITKMKNAAWNKIYRVSLFRENQIRYPWGYNYEDLGTTYRLLARADKIAFVNEPLYDYLQDRPGNLTHLFNMSVYCVLDMIKLTIDDYKRLGIYEKYYEELKFLGGINILECLKKTRDCTDYAMADEFIKVCFWYMKNTWPEFPKCKYNIYREKYDWIYGNPLFLKVYLFYRRMRMKG
ncbi:MAG: glycosyltransferase family 2 protein [Solobacterium sp.]|nr:glycosyltransferase family 2 protein [Solobacterium sp.]